MKENTLNNRFILLTGATGYVGGRLLKILEQRGYRVRCMACLLYTSDAADE